MDDMKRLIVMCGFAAILLSACGGSSSESATNAGSGQNAQASFQDYQQCLEDNGVTIDLPADRNGGGFPPQGDGPPDGNPPAGFDPSNGPGAGGGGPGMRKPDNVDQATWDKAQSACESKQPTFGGGGPQGSTEFQAYQSCMKDNGVDTTNMASVDRNSDTFKNAQTKCAELLPARPNNDTGAQQ